MKAMADKVGLKLDGIIMSLDSIYNSKSNRKAISNRNMIPNIKLRQCDLNREGRKNSIILIFFRKDSERLNVYLHGKTSSSVYYSGLSTRVKTFMDSKYLLIP